jgi:hypothetical protein
MRFTSVLAWRSILKPALPEDPAQLRDLQRLSQGARWHTQGVGQRTNGSGGGGRGAGLEPSDGQRVHAGAARQLGLRQELLDPEVPKVVRERPCAPLCHAVLMQC